MLYFLHEAKESAGLLWKEQGDFSFLLTATEPSQGVQHSQEYRAQQEKRKATSSTRLWAPSPLLKQSLGEKEQGGGMQSALREDRKQFLRD